MLKMSVSLRRSGARALAIACVFAAVTVSGVAAKDHNQNNFNGTVNETFTAVACPTPGATLFCAQSSGPGKIGDAGKVTSLFLGIVDFTPTAVPGCYAETSSGTLTAKKGDQINVTDSNTVVCLT